PTTPNGSAVDIIESIQTTLTTDDPKQQNTWSLSFKYKTPSLPSTPLSTEDVNSPTQISCSPTYIKNASYQGNHPGPYKLQFTLSIADYRYNATIPTQYPPTSTDIESVEQFNPTVTTTRFNLTNGIIIIDKATNATLSTSDTELIVNRVYIAKW